MTLLMLWTGSGLGGPPPVVDEETCVYLDNLQPFQALVDTIHINTVDITAHQPYAVGIAASAPHAVGIEALAPYQVMIEAIEC